MAKTATILQEVMADYSVVTLPESDAPDFETKPGDIIQVDMKLVTGNKSKRNLKMNACLHKYCDNAARILNLNSLECVIVSIDENGRSLEVRVDWDRDLFKEKVFKPTLMALTGNMKTRSASNADLCEVERRIHLCFAERGIDIVWPSNTPPIWRD